MMNTADLLNIFNRHRGDAIVIPGRGGRHWVNISDQPDLDVPLGDPAMGGHASFALGLYGAQALRHAVQLFHLAVLLYYIYYSYYKVYSTS